MKFWKHHKKEIIAWSLLISWLFVIFFFSSQTGGESSKLSSGVLSSIINILPVSINKNILSFSIRKLAHFTEYGILGIFLIHLIKNYKEINFKILFISMFLCFLYSCSDEFHQLFVSGRNGSFLDILIDTCGSCFGIINYVLIKNNFLNEEKRN